MLLKLYDLSMLCPSSTQLYIIEISDIWIEQNLAAGKKNSKKKLLNNYNFIVQSSKG